MDLDDMWFQQDGATFHAAREIIDLFQQLFPEQIPESQAILMSIGHRDHAI